MGIRIRRYIARFLRTFLILAAVSFVLLLAVIALAWWFDVQTWATTDLLAKRTGTDVFIDHLGIWPVAKAGQLKLGDKRSPMTTIDAEDCELHYSFSIYERLKINKLSSSHARLNLIRYQDKSTNFEWIMNLLHGSDNVEHRYLPKNLVISRADIRLDDGPMKLEINNISAQAELHGKGIHKVILNAEAANIIPAYADRVLHLEPAHVSFAGERSLNGNISARFGLTVPLTAAIKGDFAYSPAQQIVSGQLDQSIFYRPHTIYELYAGTEIPFYLETLEVPEAAFEFDSKMLADLGNTISSETAVDRAQHVLQAVRRAKLELAGTGLAFKVPEEWELWWPFSVEETQALQPILDLKIDSSLEAFLTDKDDPRKLSAKVWSNRDAQDLFQSGKFGLQFADINLASSHEEQPASRLANDRPFVINLSASGEISGEWQFTEGDLKLNSHSELKLYSMNSTDENQDIAIGFTGETRATVPIRNLAIGEKHLIKGDWKLETTASSLALQNGSIQWTGSSTEDIVLEALMKANLSGSDPIWYTLGLPSGIPGMIECEGDVNYNYNYNYNNSQSSIRNLYGSVSQATISDKLVLGAEFLAGEFELSPAPGNGSIRGNMKTDLRHLDIETVAGTPIFRNESRCTLTSEFTYVQGQRSDWHLQLPRVALKMDNDAEIVFSTVNFQKTPAKYWGDARIKLDTSRLQNYQILSSWLDDVSGQLHFDYSPEDGVSLEAIAVETKSLSLNTLTTEDRKTINDRPRVKGSASLKRLTIPTDGSPWKGNAITILSDDPARLTFNEWSIESGVFEANYELTSDGALWDRLGYLDGATGDFQVDGKLTVDGDKGRLYAHSFSAKDASWQLNSEEESTNSLTLKNTNVTGEFWIDWYPDSNPEQPDTTREEMATTIAFYINDLSAAGDIQNISEKYFDWLTTPFKRTITTPASGRLTATISENTVKSLVLHVEAPLSPRGPPLQPKPKDLVDQQPAGSIPSRASLIADPTENLITEEDKLRATINYAMPMLSITANVGRQTLDISDVMKIPALDLDGLFRVQGKHEMGNISEAVQMLFLSIGKAVAASLEESNYEEL